MLLIGWTTLPDTAAAERLAEDGVRRGLVVCAQIDGGVTSIYRWQGVVERTTEARLWLKFTPEAAGAVKAWLHAVHPYEIPQWIVVEAADVGEKYLSWARENSSAQPL